MEETAATDGMKQPNDPEPNILTTTNDIYIYIYTYTG